MKLLDQVELKLRFKHYSPKTIESYVMWIKRFILFHHKKYPKDIDFDYNRLIIWDSKYLQDRSLPLPKKLIATYKSQIQRVKLLHKKDLSQGYGTVDSPNALARKYPNAIRESKWQYLFPMSKVSKDPKSTVTRRHHVLENTFSRNLKKAVVISGIDKKVTAHTFRHSYATHLL